MQETIFLSRDNEIAIFLLEEGVPLTSLVVVTKVYLMVDDLTIDSSGNGAGLLTWDESEDWRPGVSRPVVKFKHGTSGLLTEGTYRGCRIITFDVINTNGLEWVRDLVLEVKP